MMVAEIVGIITELLMGFFGIVVNGASTLTDVFYDGENITFFGVVVFIGLAVMLLIFILRWILNLIRK